MKLFKLIIPALFFVILVLSAYSANYLGSTSYLEKVLIQRLNITTEFWLAQPVYDDIILTTSNLRVGTSAPSFVAFRQGIYGFSFINAQSDEVHGAFEIPHDYKEGSNLTVHVHWSPSTNGSGNCNWKFEYAIALMNGSFTMANLSINTSASGTPYKHQFANIGTIDGSSLKIGTIVAFKLSRPTGDTFAGDAYLHSVGLHYKIDSMGSRQVGTK